MASPFHIFRRHQRAMLVVVGILAMIGFSIGGVIDYSSSSRGGGDDPVVATAYGKNIRAGEVQQMIRRRITAINFMTQCGLAAFNFPDQLAQLFAGKYERAFGPATEEAVVRTWVLSERARQMGMVVDDDAINAFIRSETEDKVKADVMRGIVQRLGVGAPQVFDALRGELLAMRLGEMALGRMQVTPGQRWDYYRRQKQRATVEAVALQVEDFAGEVSDPPDEELRAFFDAHKDREPDPESPVPGFKVPKKAAFEVVIARFGDFLDPQSVTEEEVKEHYEKFKDTRYLWNESKFDDESEETEPAKEEEPADAKATGETPEENKANESKASEQSTPDKGAAEKSTPSRPADRDKTEGEKRSSVDAQRAIASLIARPATALAGLLAVDDADSAKKAAEQTADGKDATDGQATPEKKAGSDKKDGDKTTDEKEQKTKPQPNTKKLPAVAPPITSEYILPRDIRQGAHPKHAPLWQVEDTIRQELAREKANKKIEDTLRVVREKIRAYNRSLGADDTEVKMPDLPKVAESQGLSLVETGDVSELELREKFPDVANAHGEQPSIPFSYIAFNAMGKLQNTTVQDLETNRYLVWKTDEQEAYVPEFGDVRSKVLRVWKITKARTLVMKRAAELAEEANKAQKPLKELFASREGLTVVQTSPFSWLTRGSANVDNRAPLKISEVEGIESPGTEFMRQVFNLSVGTAGEALNAPQTVAYVVRLVSLDPSRERLRPAFLSDPFALYNEVAMEDMAEVQRAWMRGLESEARLTWKNPEHKRR